MAFVQVVEYTTSKPDDVQRLHQEWEEATKGKRSARRLVMAKHHEDSGRYCDIVFFDSYDAAMENSGLPETQDYSQRLRELVDGEPSFTDLDVVDESKL